MKHSWMLLLTWAFCISPSVGQAQKTNHPFVATTFQKNKVIVVSADGKVVADAWTIENGMLTPTLKVKRATIEERYAPHVDGWYAHERRVLRRREHRDGRVEALEGE